MINIGIIGPGRVAHRFAAAIAGMDNARLWSVCAQNEQSLTAFIEKHPLTSEISRYTDSHKFLNDPALDLAIIATPDMLHTMHVEQAIQASKHFLVEKPLCTDLDEAKKLVHMSEIADVKSGVAYHLRWHQGLRALKAMMRSPTIGQVFHMNLRWMHRFVDDAKWRKDKEKSKWWSLTTLGTHCIDIVRWYLVPLCGEVVELQLLTSSAHYQSNEETSIISMRFTHGATATITCSILFDSPLSFEIYTDKHTITAHDLVGDLDKRRIMIDHESLPFICDNNVYQDEIQDLITAINTGRISEVSLKEGCNNISCLHGLVPT
jgi:predicted dehydrogenase